MLYIDVMKKQSLLFIHLLVVLTTIQSCTPILYKLFGVETLNEFDQEKYEKTAAELSSLNSGPIHSFARKDSLFMRYAKLDTTFGTATRQPIQILYFDKKKLESFQANCYAKGSVFGNLNWNYEGRFDSFFPASAINIEQKKLSQADLEEIFQI